MIFFKDKREENEEIEVESSRDIIDEFSFQIREPLNSICGITEVLSKWIQEDFDKAQILNYMELLKSATGELQNLVHTYLEKRDDESEADNEESSEEDDYAVLKNLRIMVVEDNDTNSMVIRELLESYDAIVTTCGNGKEAIDKFTSSIPGTYDIILMDINMPQMDGYEATNRIRMADHPQAKNIPIIATTVEAYAEDVKLALRAGMNSHVSKPYNLAKIVSTIKAVK